MVWPDLVVVWKNDRNVGEFKLYRHRWLLISTKRTSKRQNGAQPSFLGSKTRVNSLFRSVLRLIRSLEHVEASKRLSAWYSEVTQPKNDSQCTFLSVQQQTQKSLHWLYLSQQKLLKYKCSACVHPIFK